MIVASDFFKKLMNKMRPLRARPDHTHIALEHIKKLWQLVQTCLAKESPKSCAARIAFGSPAGITFSRSTQLHGPELIHFKTMSIKPDHFLCEQHRAGRSHFN